MIQKRLTTIFGMTTICVCAARAPQRAHLGRRGETRLEWCRLEYNNSNRLVRNYVTSKPMCVTVCNKLISVRVASWRAFVLAHRTRARIVQIASLSVVLGVCVWCDFTLDYTHSNVLRLGQCLAGYSVVIIILSIPFSIVVAGAAVVCVLLLGGFFECFFCLVAV